MIRTAGSGINASQCWTWTNASIVVNRALRHDRLQINGHDRFYTRDKQDANVTEPVHRVRK